MPDAETHPSSDSQAWARSLVRPLSQRYLLVFAAVAALVLIDQAILQPLLVQLNFYAPVINVAGRQRMLSQKLTKDVLTLVATGESASSNVRRDELRYTLAQWTRAHRALLEGDPTPRTAPLDRSIRAEVARLDPALRSMHAAVNEIAAGGQPADPARLERAVAVILEQEPIYLRGMEQVVAGLEKSAQARVAWLRRCGLALMLAVLVLLAAVYFLVLQPAANLIRQQVEQLALSDLRHRQLAEMLGEARDALELRVAERTSELQESNAALEREMAERQSAQLRLRELSNELAHAARVTALGQLATGLAHEINQPLATVANYAGTLELALEKQQPRSAEAENLAAQIKRAALRAGAIVRRMRSFARRGAVQQAAVDLNELVREVSELCGPQLREAQVQLELDLTELPALTWADALQIQQVLVNLIQNATQAMVAAASVRRELQIRTVADFGEIAVSVSDTGPGFGADGSEKCFDSFYSTRPDGLGLGLAISRSIIQQHQREMWCENRPGGGAVVGFSLPSLPAHDTRTERRTDRVCG
ncbi:MAG: type IV pili methyl-accepting chemotaxis transducer N-terminal domain-containing protein [Planctomycetaceae bacterium]|nr:type IV pili methyl-accepting chemotaxis transducer N-terminal domain-containing protein [Planctomycetaceae bacterium]